MISSRDCTVLFKGDSYPVAVSEEMAQGGWPGGQGVMWAPSNTGVPTVTYSNGLYGGFLIWGSDEESDRFTALTQSQLVYRSATLFLGGSLILTSTYERYTYASRVGGGSLMPLVYSIQDPLYFSLRGFWTREDEPSLISAPQAPAFFTGFCAQLPCEQNGFSLGIQTSL